MGQEAGKDELIQIIRDRLQTHGQIPFDEYMALCLYHPSYGYYMSENVKLGKDGDFYTSASIGDILGMILAHYFVNVVWQQEDDHIGLELVEWGGGNGQLAKQILDTLRQEHASYYERVCYTCIETSEYHQHLQRQTCVEHLQRMRWLNESEMVRIWKKKQDQSTYVIFSNELLDAFPVKCAVREGHTWHELYVAWQKETDKPQWIPTHLSEELACYLQPYADFGEEGLHIEVSLKGIDWYRRITSAMPAGSTILTIDYGDVREELWASHRMRGTLMCYYRHQAHDDPFLHIGKQDITAHVNFSDLIKAGDENRLITVMFDTQKQFLVQAGILEHLQNHDIADPFHPVVRRNRAIRQLLLSDGMSELFKVLVQQKAKAHHDEP